MKPTVLKFGLIAGAMIAAMMFVTIPFMDRMGDKAELVGYTSMVLAFLMVFFGIRSYRENVAAGELSFARGFKVGVLITIIASACYVAAWQVIYYGFMPDFGEKYATQVLERERQTGASEAELAERQAQMQKFTELYKNPLFNIAITLLEVFPVGLIVTAISAGILRTRTGTAPPLHA